VVCNWLTGELFRYLNESQMPIQQVKITPAQLAEPIGLVEAGTINPTRASASSQRCSNPANPPKQLCKRRACANQRHERIEAIVTKCSTRILPKWKIPWRQRNRVGLSRRQVMRESRGKANPTSCKRS
jgi:aspartyl-tRNA(Asn)/glutamyl-tRNA(Gln) amidotransferase subunit B